MSTATSTSEIEFVEAISAWIPENDGPVRASLTVAIRQAIISGRLASGSRLPPERVLAKALHVSRPTVSGVIEDLRRGGFVSSRQGSGTWVSATSAPRDEPVPFVEMIQADGCIDLAAATASDASWLPPMRVETADLLMVDPSNGLIPQGLRQLRETVAQRAAAQVDGTTAANVITTSGAHQALALVVATIAPRGSTVLVEDTTFGGLVDIVLAAGCHPVGIPRDDDGPVPEVLTELIRRHNPSLVVLVSSVHSPTGTISSVDRCRELTNVLADAPTQVVLDETYADLEFTPSGRPLSVALGNDVIRVGSLSKTLWSGLRTGWIIAPIDTCLAIARRRWKQFDLGPSVASQLFALQALEGIEGRIAERCSALRGRYAWLRDALTEAFPDWQLTPVDGGLAMWVEVPGDGAEFATHAAANGVAVLPGSACRADREPTPHIRICFDRPMEVLENAIERLQAMPG